MIINFGSINIDHVYCVSKLPMAGETVASNSYEKFLGGKGINQSIAAAKAGAVVRHVGAVGTDGDWALEQIVDFGVHTDSISKLEGATGHAIVTVDDNAENQIIIEGGTNQQFSTRMIDAGLSDANQETDWVLLQNETNLAREIVERAKDRGLKVAYAAAPFIAETTISLLPHIDLLAVNEGEAAALASAMNMALEQLPVPELLVTRGAQGAEFRTNGSIVSQAAFPVDAIDTTGAGDTFLGSFLAIYSESEDAASALKYAAAASALQVTRPGAATAIPSKQEVEAFMKVAKTA